MADLYREQILDHYQNPSNFGTLDEPDITYEDSNPLCGDKIRIDINVQDGSIAEIRFSGRGCAISIASASILTEMVAGESLESIKEFSAQNILDELAIPISPARVKCALLGLKVLKSGAYGITEWPSTEEVAG